MRTSCSRGKGKGTRVHNAICMYVCMSSPHGSVRAEDYGYGIPRYHTYASGVSSDLKLQEPALNPASAKESYSSKEL